MGGGSRLTLLNAVLLGTILLRGIGDTLDALIEVVLGGSALLGFSALCTAKRCQHPYRQEKTSTSTTTTLSPR